MPSPTRHRWLETEQLSEAIIVTFNARIIIDEKAIQDIGKELAGLVDSLGQPRLLLNFNGVEHLSSSMLAKIIGLHKRTKAAGGRLALCAINPDLYEVFKITQLNKMLSIFPNEQEALQTF